MSTVPAPAPELEYRVSRVPAKVTSKMDVCDVFNKVYRGKEGSSFLLLGLENH